MSDPPSLDGALRPEPQPEIVPLALLDGYKVRWSRETVARDVVQNFFDEVDDFRQVTIDVDDERRAVEVRGPSVFDFDYLRYIGGTTKLAPGRRAAGGFGEGLKVCALVLLRDHGCALTLGGGAWEARALLRPMKLGRELCFELRRLPDPQPGSFVRIEGPDRPLRDAFRTAKDLFVHPDNPRLKDPIHVDAQAGIGVYEPHGDHWGHLYYRRQHRGRLRFRDGGALTFRFDDRLPALEGDRDRRNLAAALPLVAALAARLPDEVLERLIRRLRASWNRGGGVLTALVAAAARRGLRLTFPRRWLARLKDARHLHEHAGRVGFHLGIPHLAALGMPTVEDRFGPLSALRAPAPVESARLQVARDLYLQHAQCCPAAECRDGDECCPECRRLLNAIRSHEVRS